MDADMRMWKIDDGETHHVAAVNAEDALRLAAKGLGLSLEEMKEDRDPRVELADYTKPLVIRFDDAQDAREFAKATPGATMKITVTLPQKAWASLKPGLVSSTCW